MACIDYHQHIMYLPPHIVNINIQTLNPFLMLDSEETATTRLDCCFCDRCKPPRYANVLVKPGSLQLHLCCPTGVSAQPEIRVQPCVDKTAS